MLITGIGQMEMESVQARGNGQEENQKRKRGN